MSNDLDIWIQLILDYLRTQIGAEVTCKEVEKEKELTQTTKQRNMRLLVHTDYGQYLFFINHDFGLSTWIMLKKLRQIGWEKPGVLLLPDVIVDKKSGVAIVPAIVDSNKRLAMPWYHCLKSLNTDDHLLIAQRLAQAITRFDRSPVARVDIKEELNDLIYIRHDSTNQVPPDILASLEGYWSGWEKIVEKSLVSLAPRDFYRNLLIGAPIFSSSRKYPLTLIDFGESYKLSSATERLAQCILTTVYISELDSKNKLRWIRSLSQACQSLGIHLESVGFYMTLWAIRWHLWDLSAKPDLTPFFGLFQKNERLETPSKVLSFCETIL